MTVIPGTPARSRESAILTFYAPDTRFFSPLASFSVPDRRLFHYHLSRLATAGCPDSFRAPRNQQQQSGISCHRR